MKSVCTSLEDKILAEIRGLDLPVAVTGLFETASAGEVKQEDLSALQVKVTGVTHPHEAHDMWSCSLELRLTVEQAESADGSVFRSAYDAVAGWVERTVSGAGCSALDTDEVCVDGLQPVGGDADYDISGGEWFAVWNVTLTGRMKGA